MKKLEEKTTHEILLALCNDEDFEQMKQKILTHPVTMCKQITYVRSASFIKNSKISRAAPVGTRRVTSAISICNQLSYKLLNTKFFSANEKLKTYEMEASLTGRKFSSIPGDLVTEVTANREVKIRGGRMRDGYSTSVEAVDDFILNTHALANLWRVLKNSINYNHPNRSVSWSCTKFNERFRN